jgi:hypothetical protein
MLPVLAVLVVAIAIGYALGGRLRNFEHLRINRWALAIAGLALQTLPAPALEGMAARVAGPLMLGTSYVLLLAFLAANRWIPGASVMAIGLLLNLLVVAVNGGMPVRASAVERAGGDPAVLIAADDAKHHVMDADDILWPLADVIPIPAPARLVISFGDVVLYGGIAYSIVQIMRGRRLENPRPFAWWFPEYRGKHAPAHWRIPARYRAPGRAGAGRSGTEP